MGMIEALPNRIMLAVDRQQGCSAAAHFLHDQSAGADEYLLVCQGDDDPASNRGQCRSQPRRADNSRHHPIGGALRRLHQRLRT